jgi:hypothetical protein
MKITRTEAENIMNMLTSSDKENGYLAFKAIEAHDFDNREDSGFLIYFYKFSKFTMVEWTENSPVASAILSNLFTAYRVDSGPLTYSRALTIMAEQGVSKDSIELFLERHVKDLTNSLESLGYPMDKLEFSVKLRK